MTLRALVIGIGSGSAEHLTGEARVAMNEVDLFLVADKGAGKHDLAVLRHQLCRAVIDHEHYRVVEVPDPERGPDRERDAAAYAAGVEAWHQARAERYASIINRELPNGGTVGFLVLGDPALYDSTIRIVESIAALGIELELRVLPGISSVQLLAARHKIILNRIGQPVHLTTGRRLVTEYSSALGDVVVMLDADLACAGLMRDHPNLTIYWGAQLGLPDEVIVSGPLAAVITDIRSVRERIRAARGWVMDIYLLRPAAARAG